MNIYMKYPTEDGEVRFSLTIPQAFAKKLASYWDHPEFRDECRAINVGKFEATITEALAHPETWPPDDRWYPDEDHHQDGLDLCDRCALVDLREAGSA